MPSIPKTNKVIKIKTKRLDEIFCENHINRVNYLSIDVEGAEFKVFQNMGQYKPICIWTETGAIYHYSTGITLEEFHKYMESIGYYIIYDSGWDTLYCQSEYEFTPYIPLQR